MPKILDFGDMDSQKWLEYARYKPFPLSLGYRLEGSKLERAEKRLARRFDLCTATTRAEWETLEGYGTGVADRLVSERRRCRLLRADGRSLRPRHDRFVGRMDYYPNQECMFDFCAKTLPLAARAAAQRQAADRRRRPVAGHAQAGRAARRHGHRLGAGRAAVPARARR